MLTHLFGFIMDNIGGNVVQKSNKTSSRWFNAAVAKDPPGVMTNDQTSHPLLGEKIVLKPLHGLPIQLSTL